MNIGLALRTLLQLGLILLWYVSISSLLHGSQGTVLVCFKCVWLGWFLVRFLAIWWFKLVLFGHYWVTVGREILVYDCDSLPNMFGIILVELCGHEFKLAFTFFKPPSSNCSHGTLYKLPTQTATVVVALFWMLDILVTLKRALFLFLLLVSKKNAW